MIKRFFVCVVLVLASIAFSGVAANAQKPIRDLKPTVILISRDVLRYDYVDNFAPPILSILAKQVVRAK